MSVIFLEQSGTWIAPSGNNRVTIEAIGGGGGVNAPANNQRRGGAGGGAYARATLDVTGGQMIEYIIGSGGAAGANGGDTMFRNNSTCLAKGGSGTTSTGGGQGGQASASVGTVTFSGGNGAASTGSLSGGGGAAAGSAANGHNASGATGGSSQRQSVVDASYVGGGGGAGRTSAGSGENGLVYGGGAGGSFRSGSTGNTAQSGGAGLIILTIEPLSGGNDTDPTPTDPPPATELPPNLIINPNVIMNGSDTGNSGRNTVLSDADGTYHQVTATANGNIYNAFWSENQVIHMTEPFVQGETYTLRFTYRTTQPANPTYFWGFFGVGTPARSIQATNEWTTVTYVYTQGEVGSASNLLFGFNNLQAGHVIAWRDFSIYKGDITQIIVDPTEPEDPVEPPPPAEFNPKINTNGLVIYYDFGRLSNGDPESTYAKNLAQDGLDGNLMNFAFNDTSGYVENGLRYDGVDDTIIVPYSSQLDVESYTIEVGVTPLQSLTWVDVVWREGEPYEIGFATNNLYALARGGGQAYYEVPQQAVSGVMNFVTVTYSSGTLSVYLNGEFMGDTAHGGPLDYYDTPLRIGGAWGWGRMVISSFRLYNRVLSEQEILLNYHDETKRYPLPPVDIIVGENRIGYIDSQLRLNMKGELIETRSFSFDADGNVYAQELIEGNGFNIGQHNVTVTELIEDAL